MISTNPRDTAILIVVALLAGTPVMAKDEQKPPAAAVSSTPRPGKEYKHGKRKVYFPQGDLSFADRVVDFRIGKPAAKERDSDPTTAIGPPDYTSPGKKQCVSLGCEGVLVVEFVDNALIDIEGPDLYIFEVGPQVEATALAISADGKKWIEVGRISGGHAEVDIADHVGR